MAKTFGATGRLSGKITPLMISEYMSTIKDDEAKPMLDTVLLRCMAKARYAPDCLGHFGLASKFYCHFTSPIRRYPDLYIHRIIKSYIHGEKQRRHFAGLVGSVSDHSSEMERNSVEAERASDDVKIAQYMADKIGQRFEGRITSIIGAGVFVMLPSTVEGFVPFRTMADHYIFDERAYRAIGSRTGRKLTIGMEVEVIVAAVDTDMNRIDFVFSDEVEGSVKKSHGKDDKPMPGRRKARTIAKKRGKKSRRSF